MSSKRLEDLSKTNFWDAMKTLYPKTWVLFSDWIDQYKKDNDWERLFNAQDKEFMINEQTPRAPKYHELPMFMQVGIFYQFLADQSDEIDDAIQQVKEVIMTLFKEVEKEL